MKKIYKYILLLLLSGGLLSSCSDDDEKSVYNETNTERFNQQEKELYNLLQSSEQGWKMTYFTDDPRYTTDTQQLGGWSFVFKFTDNQNVTMISDYSQETLTPKESEYEIKVGSTVKLSFVTANWISLLTDSANFPVSALEGYGYKGDNEFLYYGQEGEDLIFRSNREQIEIRFEKATQEDWDNLEEARQIGELLNNNDLVLEIDNGNEVREYDLIYFRKSRYVTNKDSSNLSFGIAFKPDGLKVIKPIPVGNEEATDFVFDEANYWFIAELSDGKTAKIVLDEPEPTVQLFEEEGDFTFQGVDWLFNSPTTASYISDVWNPLFTNIDENTDLQLGGFFITNTQIQYLLYDSDGETVYIIHNFNYSLDEDNNRIILTDNGWDNADDQNTYENLVQPLENVLFDSEGFIINEIGNLNGYPGFTITSYSNLDLTFIVLGGF